MSNSMPIYEFAEKMQPTLKARVKNAPPEQAHSLLIAVWEHHIADIPANVAIVRNGPPCKNNKARSKDVSTAIMRLYQIVEFNFEIERELMSDEIKQHD